VALIDAFEVPPGSDEAFLRDFGVPSSGVLYRALRDDAALRFVHVAPAEPRAGAYAVVHEDGEPEGAGGTVLITPFEVPADGDERFLAHWHGLRALFAGRQGYLGSRLYRRTGSAGLRYVAIVRWSSPLMYARTLRQPEAEQATAEQPFPGKPALYARYLIAS
jgi:heme-degrading monooxygenase HmoA